MESPALKTINYRGGVVRFRIPADWREEYEDAGGGTFYKAGDNTGTLRLNVITGAAPPGQQITVGFLTKLLAGDSAKYGVATVPLGESVVMIRYDMPGEERGQPLRIRCWRLFQALPPDNFRHALFTYTLHAERFDRPESIMEMELLDREIAVVELAPALGQSAAPKKQWWRPW